MSKNLEAVFDSLEDSRFVTVSFAAGVALIDESNLRNVADPSSPVLTWYDAGFDWCRLTKGERGVKYPELELSRTLRS